MEISLHCRLLRVIPNPHRATLPAQAGRFWSPSPPPLPGSPLRYTIRALGLGWETCCGRPALTPSGLPPPYVGGTSGTSTRRLKGGMGLLPRRPQERLRTRPSHTSLVRVEQEGVGIDKPDQIGRVEVPLHLQATGGTVMHPLRQRFLRDATTLTGLRQFGRAGGNGYTCPPALAARRVRICTKLPGARRWMERPYRRCHAR